MATAKQGTFLYLLLLSVNCVQLLEAPKDVRASFYEPSGVYVEWEDVPSDFRDPISGYKIKLWAIKEETTRNYKLLNGEQYPGLETNDFAKEPFGSEHTSEQEISEITQVTPTNNARVKHLRPNKLYEIRVMAYKGDKIGPMSEPKRVKLVKNNNFVLIAQRSQDSCGASIIVNGTNAADPFVHHSFL